MAIITEEIHYLRLLADVLTNGEYKDDRTKTGTIALFGVTMKFNMKENELLFVTTKRLYYRSVILELLWIISGSTDALILKNQKVSIWDGNSSSQFLKDNGLPYREGDIGPGYGFQLRHFGAEYKGCDADYTGQGTDQLQNLINDCIDVINGNYKADRRLVICFWNPSQTKEMALPPCHDFFQLNLVRKDEMFYLDGSLTMRSNDALLGCPFNMASYCIWMYMIAFVLSNKCNKKIIPRSYTHHVGNFHIYSNHIEQVKEQLKRPMHEFPTLKFKRVITDIDNFKYDDFEILDYKCGDKISGNMAV
jgi:thymidylate synthase